MRTRPAFTAAVLLTLTLGIGANAAIFSVVNAVLLRPLPYAHPERLVHLWETFQSLVDSRSEASYPDYLDWRDRNHTFSDLAGYHGAGYLFGAQHPIAVGGARSTANFFQVLGVTPALGRRFTAGEDAVGAPGVALVSYGFWQRDLGRDPSVVGRVVTIDGERATIVGVLPEEFHLARVGGADIWMPINRSAQTREQRGNHWLNIIARLKDGVTTAAASADMTAIMHDLARENPPTNAGREGQVVPLRDELVGPARPLILVLYGAVSVVLLVACANVANLLLMRGAEREREVAVRRALGAGRSRLIRQLLTESLLLTAAGGVLGAALARFGVRALVGAIPIQARTTIPALSTAAIDTKVIAYCCLISLLAGLLFSLLPALRAWRPQVYDSLKQGARGSSGGRAARDLLVVAELALTIILMSGAALFGRSLIKLLAIQLGFRAEHVITAGVALPDASYKEDRAQIAVFNRMVERARELPGVQDVGLTTKLPLDYGNSLGFEIAGRPPSLPGQEPTASYRDVSPSYFSTLQIPLVRGRPFGQGDDLNAPRVAIVNRSLAQAYFGGTDPIGQSLVLDDGALVIRVVGVVGDVPIGKLEDPIPPTLYMPFAQSPDSYMSIAVRTGGDVAEMSRNLSRVIGDIEPGAAVMRPATMDALLSESASVFMRRFPLLLVGAFAGTTLLLALVGIYGVVSYSVANRTREMGIRMALGAQAISVVKLILRDAVWMAGAGVAVGLVLSVILGRFVSSLLYGVSAHDPLTFIFVAVVLAATAIAATLPAARRATRVDPGIALRVD